MVESVQKFYDGLASHYRLMFENFEEEIPHQGRVLNRVIRKYHKSRGRLSLLDCSCGIGTQALGLARYSYRIRATDLSPQAVRLAKKNAKRLGVSISFGTADFRKLSRQVQGQFDVVMSCENALPHLLTDRDLLLGLRNIRSKLNSGGFFLLGIRDYDALLKDKPTSPRKPLVHRDTLGERIYFQVWNWKKGKNIYKISLFLLRRLKGSWKTECHETYYRALSRAEASRLMRKAGFSKIRWLMPKNTGYLQPLAVAFQRNKAGNK